MNSEFAYSNSKLGKADVGKILGGLYRHSTGPNPFQHLFGGLQHLGKVHVTRFQASRGVTISYNPFKASRGIIDLETCFKWLQLTRATPI